MARRTDSDASRRDSDRLQHLYLTGVRPNGNIIGGGAYGKVFEVEFCGSLYAAKQIHSVLVDEVEREAFERMKRMFIAECLQSSALGHENVVHVLGVYNPGGDSLLPVLVMERMQDSLTSLVEKYLNIPMCVKVSMLEDVSRGLWYLHSHNPPIVHRDLSPNNVLLTSQFVAKISDLGVAKVIKADSQKTKTRVPGTVDFMPPEALDEHADYGPPLDVFSYGGVMLHVVNQEWPKPRYNTLTDPKTKNLVALSEVARRREYLEKMKGAPANLRHLVEKCLDNDPKRRPLISDVSMIMKKIKEAESMKSPDVTMDPTTWKQTNSKPAILDKPVSVKWKEAASLPLGRSAHTAVFLQGSVYVGGGLEGKSVRKDKDCCKIDIYNVHTNQWSALPIATPHCGFALAVLNDKLVIAGGCMKSGEITNKVLVLDEGEWTYYNEMRTARYNLAAVGYQSMLITVGGLIDNVRTDVAITEILDTANGSWYTCSDLPMPHYQLKCVVMNNVLYVLGGKHLSPSTQAFAASIDNLSSSHQLRWHPIPDAPWCFSAPIVLHNKFLLTFGGREPSNKASQTTEVCAFNPSTDSWKQIATAPEARSCSAVVGVAENKILLLGGTTKQEKYSSEAWLGTFQ